MAPPGAALAGLLLLLPLRASAGRWPSQAGQAPLAVDNLAVNMALLDLGPAAPRWPEAGKAPQASQAAVPVTVALALSLVAAVTYLCYTWRQRGVVAHPSRGFPSGRAGPAAVALTCYLGLLVGVDLLVKHEAELGRGSYSTSPIVVVVLAEFGKLLASCALYAASSHAAAAPAAAAAAKRVERAQHGARAAESRAEQGGGPDEVAEGDERGNFWKVAKLMLPVALLYNANNLLVLVVLARVRMDSYAVWRNMSILFNAVIWVWALNRSIEPHRWVAVVICLLGTCFNCLGIDGAVVVDRALLAVLLSALLSSVASVFNERVMKSKEAEALDFNTVNILLYSETLCLMLVGGLVSSAVTVGFPSASWLIHTLTSITPGAWKIICGQIAIGLCVSRVLKHADAVAKTVVASFREVAIVFLAPSFVSATRFDVVSVGSAVLVGIAGLIYSMPAGLPQEPAPDAPDAPAFRAIEKLRA